MSDERRYSEQEIATIFEQAAEAQEAAHQSRSSGEGLTLAELQQIGKEAGITPEFIARAAARIGQVTPASPPPATYLGLPISVARTVELPGPLSEKDWDRLVVDLRETFQATGEIRRDGALREWRNGNLHALVEPTESGHRLRFRTRKGSAQQSFSLSFFFLVIGAIFLALLAAKSDPEPGMMVIMSLFVAAGLGGAGLTAYRLPRWAQERERQMDAIAARAVERMTAPAAAEMAPGPTSTDHLGLDELESYTGGASSMPHKTRT